MPDDIYGRKSGKEERQRIIELIDEAPILASNKEHIKRFLSETSATGTGPRRLNKLGWGLRRIAQVIDKDFTLVTRDDLILWLDHLQTSMEAAPPLASFKRHALPTHRRLSPSTKKDYARLTKRFFYWLGKRDAIENLPFAIKNEKRVRNIITEDHLQQIVEREQDMRNKALLWILHESGMRTGELLAIRMHDIQRVQYGVKIRVDGKTGERFVPLVKSVPLLYRWLEEHPQRDQPDAFLWVSRHNGHAGDRVCYLGLRKIINGAFSRAGLGHIRHNPHQFRHSRATILANKLTDVQLCLYLGWEFGTKQVRTYVHASGRDLDAAVWNMYGLAPKETAAEQHMPIRCALCKYENMSGASFCTNCGNTLNVAVAVTNEEKYNAETEKTLILLQEILANPSLLKQFRQYQVKSPPQPTLP